MKGKRITYNDKEGIVTHVYDCPALRENGIDEIGQVALVDFKEPNPHFAVMLVSELVTIG